MGKEGDPISKITRAKRAGGVTQAVECLPCKGKKVDQECKTGHVKGRTIVVGEGE
jgi:hypothetical protein